MNFDKIEKHIHGNLHDYPTPDLDADMLWLSIAHKMDNPGGGDGGSDSSGGGMGGDSVAGNLSGASTAGTITGGGAATGAAFSISAC